MCGIRQADTLVAVKEQLKSLQKINFEEHSRVIGYHMTGRIFFKNF